MRYNARVSAVGARGSSAQQRKKLLVDALLLALRRSEVARVVDMGTLEYFLDSSYAEMARGDSIDLAKLWDVLAKEPGIEPRMIFPPMLAYKSWEARLGVTVFLPGPVKALPLEERKEHEARIPIKPSELDQMLTERKLAPPKAPQPGQKSSKSIPKRRTSIHIVPVAIIAAAALVLVIFVGAWWALTPRGPARVDLSPFSHELALRDGKRLGDSMSAVITDGGFASQSVEERTRRVSAVFTLARRQGVRSMLLFDEKGAVKATAQSADGQPDQVAVSP
jgi:hypothetical protein